MRLLFLLISLNLHSQHKCTISCEKFQQNDWNGLKCWYELKPVCTVYQPECVDSSSVVCENWARDLGAWFYVPEDQKTYFYTPPVVEEPERKRYDYYYSVP